MKFTDYLKGFHVNEDRCEMHKRKADRKAYERSLRLHEQNARNHYRNSLKNRIYEEEDDEELDPSLTASLKKIENYKNLFKKFIRKNNELQEANEFNEFEDDENDMRSSIGYDIGRSVKNIDVYKLIQVPGAFINWLNKKPSFKEKMEDKNYGICGIYATERNDKSSLWGIALGSESNSILCLNFSKSDDNGADYQDPIILNGTNEFLSFIFHNKINNVYFIVNTTKNGESLIYKYLSLWEMDNQEQMVANKLSRRNLRKRSV